MHDSLVGVASPAENRIGDGLKLLGVKADVFSPGLGDLKFDGCAVGEMYGHGVAARV